MPVLVCVFGLLLMVTGEYLVVVEGWHRVGAAAMLIGTAIAALGTVAIANSRSGK